MWALRGLGDLEIRAIFSGIKEALVIILGTREAAS